MKRTYDMGPKVKEWWENPRRYLMSGVNSPPVDPHKSCNAEIAYLKEVIREKDDKIERLERNK